MRFKNHTCSPFTLANNKRTLNLKLHVLATIHKIILMYVAQIKISLTESLLTYLTTI